MENEIHQESLMTMSSQQIQQPITAMTISDLSEDNNDNDDDDENDFNVIHYILTGFGLQHLVKTGHLNVMDILHTFGSLLALFGCLCHLIAVSRIYFAYNTDMNVIFKRETKIDIPAITICSNISKMANEVYLLGKYSTKLKQMNEYPQAKYLAYEKLLKNLTLNEQLNLATISAEQLFHHCKIVKPMAFERTIAGDYISCTDIVPIREFISLKKKCYSIGLQLNDESNDRFIIDHDTTIRDNGFPLMIIHLLNEYIDNPKIYVESRKTPYLAPIGGHINFFRANNSKFESISFNFAKTKNQLLEPPYRTNCRHYEEIGYKSLMHCMNHCKAQYFIDHFNGWHANIPANNGDNLDIHFAPAEYRKNKTLDKIVSNKCSQFCSKRQDCVCELFKITIMEEIERNNENIQLKDRFQLKVMIPIDLNKYYTHKPRMEWIEFICFYASTISLWFGFSIIAFARSIMHLIHHNCLIRLKKEKSNEYKTEETN
nr:uncharacterized protein LOC124493476 [Dermatophagoides farinae]